jgi:hypothetical protein
MDTIKTYSGANCAYRKVTIMSECHNRSSTLFNSTIAFTSLAKIANGLEIIQAIYFLGSPSLQATFKFL